MADRTGPAWKVLVILGASGTGKSTAAEAIARSLGINAIEADDLRLALQYSNLLDADRAANLTWFMDNPDFAFEPTEDVCRAFIAVGEAMLPAIRIVLENHVATAAPIVIEGDCILPSLMIDPLIRHSVIAGSVRFCCVEATSHRELLENMTARGRGMHDVDLERAARHTDANWAFNHWLAATSRSLGISVVSSQPFDTLADRIEQAVRKGPSSAAMPISQDR